MDNPLQQLKAATTLAHQQTEKVALAQEIKSGQLTVKQYFHLLACNLFIHQSLEKVFESSIAQLEIPTYATFFDKKSSWLEADLKENSHPIIWEEQFKLPQYRNQAALSGGLYVLEGSMLGGQFITKKLKQSEHLKAIDAFRFYQGYGEQTGKRWRNFCQLAIHHLQTAEDLNVAIQSAKETFQFFQQVYQSQLKNPSFKL